MIPFQKFAVSVYDYCRHPSYRITLCFTRPVLIPERIAQVYVPVDLVPSRHKMVQLPLPETDCAMKLPIAINGC